MQISICLNNKDCILWFIIIPFKSHFEYCYVNILPFHIYFRIFNIFVQNAFTTLCKWALEHSEVCVCVCVCVYRSSLAQLTLYRDVDCLCELIHLGGGDNRWMANTGGTRIRTRNLRYRRSMLYASGQPAPLHSEVVDVVITEVLLAVNFVAWWFFLLQRLEDIQSS